jgi:predicted RNase H-like nuclease
LEYKKGRLSDHYLELIKLYNYITEILPSLQLPLCSLHLGDFFVFEIPNTSASLKEVEDKLDSLICAYVAAYWWYWGEQRNLVLGDRTTGYIVIPKEI